MTRSRLLTTLGVLIALCVLVLVGCGGNSNGKRLTKAEYAAKANAPCVSFNHEFDALGRGKIPGGRISRLTAAKKALDELFRFGEKTVASLKKLRPPADEEVTAKQAIGLAEAVLKLEAAAVAELNKGDARQATKLQNKMAPSILKYSALNHALGVECNMFLTP